MKKFMLTVMVGLMVLGGGSKLLADDPSDSFDIMYVYTTDAKNYVGGTEAIQSLIHDTIEQFNQSFINSNMDLRVNLVHTEEVTYLPDGDFSKKVVYEQTLSHLENSNDGYLDQVHMLRNKYSADFVHMFIMNRYYAGYACPNYYNSPSCVFGISSVSVHKNNDNLESTLKRLEASLATARRASIHEVGHNLGIAHAPDTNIYPSYARGYGESIVGGNSINYWSSPIVYNDGVATGTVGSDARRAILEDAPIFSNFRKRPVTIAPTLSINPPSETFDSSVTIEINGESGYEVYVDGVYKGVLNYNGKKTLTLNLLSVHNNFSITLKHEPSGTVSNVLQLSIIKKIDTDSDGIYDHIEEALGLNPNNADSDGDGYTDLEEVGDINNPKDTDNDGTIDALDLDSDNDGISDKDERLASIIITTIIVPYILYED